MELLYSHQYDLLNIAVRSFYINDTDVNELVMSILKKTKGFKKRFS